MRATLRQVGLALAPTAGMTLVWMLAFALARALLIAATRSDSSPTSTHLLLAAFWHGARFDLAMTAALITPFALWAVWRVVPVRWERAVVHALLAATVGVVVLLVCIEVEFYKEFEARLGPLAFDYVSAAEERATLIGMVWHGYPVLPWLFSALLIALALTTALWWMLSRARSHISAGARILATLLLIPALVIGIRGGIGRVVLRSGAAFFSQDVYANHMALNSVFVAYQGLLNASRDGPDDVAWRGSLSRPEFFDEMRRATLLPGERLLDPERDALLRMSPPAQVALRKRPRNVVVVMMESFSARFVGAVGARRGVTPNFDAMSRQGILFDRAFSGGSHTHQGVYTTLCSIPNGPIYEKLMKHPVGLQPLRSLPAILNENGFNSIFLYNGRFVYDNMEGFFRNQGVRQFIDRDDYQTPIFMDPDWGVSDGDVFDRAVREFSRFDRAGHPFLGIILTLSNHAPFNLPPTPGLPKIEKSGLTGGRMRGVQYADWALGRFIEDARKQPWFDDTLFVFVGDHGFAMRPLITEVSLLRMHVPLLFFGPGILQARGEVRHTVAGQLDIVPTILGILGIPGPHASFGRDLFSLPPDDPGHAFVKASGSSFIGWVEGDQILVSTAEGPATLHQIDLGFPASASPDLSGSQPERTKALERRLRAFVVGTIDRLQEGAMRRRESATARKTSADGRQP